ncbi:C4-dicarboxylate ABC transporter permease [Methanocella sp. CWC-04]|uniref:C4-dicarboxylate ABC transporter permease n=1 Tax=Methanooceanicella nereidis TaxID=2052831 RepID=A0AAP2W4V0_9EURY|nr:TRAP transporter permease [Methanocella sp. CWC-04]MCD1293652.1 C4-dicarboxylate ABC transporter permease [Methanocella sp. CWC-04]
MSDQEAKLDYSEIDELEAKYSNFRSLGEWALLVVSAFAIISSLYHLYAAWHMPKYQLHLSMHLMFMLVLAFSIYPISKKVLSGKRSMDRIPVYDLAFAALSAFVCLYWIYDYDNIIMRAGIETDLDLLVGAIGILLVLEATRRTVGVALSILSGLFLLYAYVGPYLPGIFAHRGYSFERIISHIWYTDQGVFGVPLYISATYVIVFILFGAFLKHSGAGEFFINLAYGLTGYRKGGPAKTAILASGFLGMINGSSIANTVTTGVFTIPLMKKAGYRKEFAGGMEAASSTGGQIMPPVMGAAAFIMVEFTGIGYNNIIVSAAIPAFAFFFGLWIMAHLEAGKAGLKSVPKSELPDVRELMRTRGYMCIPVILLLVLLLFVKLTIMYSAFFSLLAVILCSYIPDLWRLLKERRYIDVSAFIIPFPVVYLLSRAAINASNMDAIFYGSLVTILFVLAVNFVRKDLIVEGMYLKDFKGALEDGTKSSLGVALACGSAGIISGIATLTGLGLKIAALVGSISGGVLFIALILTVIACIILGMGLPTTATYIVLVTMAAPAILGMSLPDGSIIPVLAVHMFVLYYGVVADITPPVALAAYAASGISNSNQFWTGIEAFKISLNKFFVPFAFIYSPAILLLGIDWNDPWSIGSALFDIATVFVGIICLQAALSGYLFTHTKTIERIILFVAALSLIFPNIPGAVFGVTVLITVAILHKARILSGPEGSTMDGIKKMMSSMTVFNK